MRWACLVMIGAMAMLAAVETDPRITRLLDAYGSEVLRADDARSAAVQRAEEGHAQTVARARATAITGLRRLINPRLDFAQQAQIQRAILALDRGDAEATRFFVAIGTLDAVLAELDAQPVDFLAESAGDRALASLGARVQPRPGLRDAEELINGVATGYTGNSGFAQEPWPCSWVIELDRAYPLRLIRMLLWDGGPRQYRYTIEVSPDGTRWAMAMDRANQGASGWQEIPLPGQSLRYIRINGLHNTANSGFHVVEVEAHVVPP